MTNALKLRKSYPYEFLNAQYLTPKIHWDDRDTRGNVGPLLKNKALEIVCKSPAFGSAFASMLLSYDPSISVTSGFLSFAPHGSYRLLLESLEAAAIHAKHPMLLPVVFCSTWVSLFSHENIDIKKDLRAVQRDTKMMAEVVGPGVAEPNLPSAVADAASEEAKVNLQRFDRSHKKLVLIQNDLENAMANFVMDFCHGLMATLQEFNKRPRGQLKELLEEDNRELEDCARSMQLVAAGEMGTRQRMLGRMDMQLKVVRSRRQVSTKNYNCFCPEDFSDPVRFCYTQLYNQMQKEDNHNSIAIARASKDLATASQQDSSAMKSIAILTMVFLPGTAVATLFSVSTFFSTSPRSPHLTVSSSFWIYWVVTVPLTLVVLIIWRLWMKRAEDYHGDSSRLESDLEKGSPQYERSENSPREGGASVRTKEGFGSGGASAAGRR
ncbi:hypothetical protein GP486_008324 [Trichoglossum hirsutum]|uniref:Uncharacterized protein n=1 Tax=Trichoglossum hirsutum TaxID=265104 RepID=A0A9P8L477_9PEZI|nr:hypothetical protein GP486_008324 [Trichoglossum hirsutum]